MHMKRLVALTVVVVLMSFGMFFVSCDNEEALQNLLEIAQSTEGLESLLVVIAYIEKHVEDAGVLEDLADHSLSFTVFAPNNAAFVEFFGAEGTILTETDITESSLRSLVETDEEFAGELLDVLGLHVIEDQELYETDIIAADNSSIGPTLYGEGTNYLDVAVSVENIIRLTPDIVQGVPAYIETTDIEASNGVAHIIDGVLYSNAIPE